MVDQLASSTRKAARARLVRGLRDDLVRGVRAPGGRALPAGAPLADQPPGRFVRDAVDQSRPRRCVPAAAAR